MLFFFSNWNLPKSNNLHTTGCASEGETCTKSRLFLYGSSIDEIKKIDGSEILNDIGLGYSISSQRTNGFVGAVNKIKMEL